MEIVLTALILILAIVGLIAVAIRIFNDLKIILDKIKIKRKRIARIDILWNSVKNMDNRLPKVEKQVKPLQESMDKIDREMDKIDREMDAFHARIIKHFKKVLDEKTGKIDKRIDLAFKRINALAETDTPTNERFTQIERRQKEYDTSLMTQAKMIGDLQAKSNKKGE